MLTDVLTECLVEPLYTVAMLLCVLRNHGNDGAHQLLSHVAACLQEAWQEKGKHLAEIRWVDGVTRLMINIVQKISWSKHAVVDLHVHMKVH